MDLTKSEILNRELLNDNPNLFYEKSLGTTIVV